VSYAIIKESVLLEGFIELPVHAYYDPLLCFMIYKMYPFKNTLVVNKSAAKLGMISEYGKDFT